MAICRALLSVFGSTTGAIADAAAERSALARIRISSSTRSHDGLLPASAASAHHADAGKSNRSSRGWCTARHNSNSTTKLFSPNILASSAYFGFKSDERGQPPGAPLPNPGQPLPETLQSLRFGHYSVRPRSLFISTTCGADTGLVWEVPWNRQCQDAMGILRSPAIRCDSSHY